MGRHKIAASMRLLIAAVLLVNATNTISHVPLQSDSVERQQKHKKANQGNKTGDIQPLLKEEKPSESKDKKAARDADKTQVQKMNITALPREINVQTVKEPLDRYALYSTIAMAIIAGIGTIIAVITLFYLRHHAKSFSKIANAAKDSAQVALLSAQAVVNSERPWIVVTVQNQPKGLYMFVAQNRGRTPAEIESVDADHIFARDPFKLPVPPKYSAPVIAPPKLQPADSTFEIRTVKPTAVIDNNRKRDALNNGEEFLCFYGRVTYWDIMTKGTPRAVLHETRWCFAVNFFGDSLNDERPFVETGSCEYSMYT